EALRQGKERWRTGVRPEKRGPRLAARPRQRRETEGHVVVLDVGAAILEEMERGPPLGLVDEPSPLRVAAHQDRQHRILRPEHGGREITLVAYARRRGLRDVLPDANEISRRM